MTPPREETQIARREFLGRTAAAGAGLVIGFYLPRKALDALGAAPDEKVFAPNAWLEILNSGEVNIWVGRSEMGQGPRTSVPMLMADELDADWSKVRVRQADFGEKYGDQLTGGSFSTRYAWGNLRKPAAAAREMLISAAANTWKVQREECFARDGGVTHRTSGRRMTYGELTAKAATLPVPQDPPLKSAKEFRIVGTSKPRVDGAKIVTGKAGYGIDVRVPGMLYAVVARPVVFGAKVRSFDAAKANSVAGVRHVVEVPRAELPIPFELKPGAPGHQHFLWGGVAVVAESLRAAVEGRRALQIEWEEGAGAAESTAGMREQFRNLALQPGNEVRKVGDAEAAFEKAAVKIEADYELPFLSHAPMEPPNCTARVGDGRCELWVPTQNAPAVAKGIEMALGLPPSAITIHITLLGGGFGRRLNPDYGVEAALISKSAGAPVKVIWTREDDIQHDYYRPNSFHRLSAGVSAEKKVVAWLHHCIGPSTDRFYEGTDTPDAGGAQIAGSGASAGTVPNYRLTASIIQTAVPRGWWRSVDSSTNVFVVQSFIDEIAAALKRDPLDLRRELIGPPNTPPTDPERVNLARLRRVFDLAAEKAGWGTPLPQGCGRGIAGSFDSASYTAQVAEVSVSKEGTIRVHRVVCAFDCGQVVNPDMVKAQIEGAILFGLSAALKGEITIENGRVQQSNFHNYPVMRMNETPAIEVHIVPSAESPGGCGEPGVPPIAPAVANAIFSATGKRVRHLPIRAQDLA